jgi:hypothetical protein
LYNAYEVVIQQYTPIIPSITPKPEMRGLIRIESNIQNAPFVLLQGTVAYEGNTGIDTYIEGLQNAGEYTIIWLEVAGYETPMKDNKTLLPAETLVFKGNYIEGTNPSETPTETPTQTPTETPKPDGNGGTSIIIILIFIVILATVIFIWKKRANKVKIR